MFLILETVFLVNVHDSIRHKERQLVELLTPLCEYFANMGSTVTVLRCSSIRIGCHDNFANPAIVLGSMFKLLVHVYIIKAHRETTTFRPGCPHLWECMNSTGSTVIVFRNRKFFILCMQMGLGTQRDLCICKAPRPACILLDPFGVLLYTFLHSFVSLAVCRREM